MGAVLGAILWPLVQFLILPLRKMKQRIIDAENEAMNLKKKIESYRKEASTLFGQVNEFYENIHSLEETLTLIADKIGLKGDLFAWGRLMFLEGNIDAALATFDELLNTEPSNANAHYYRGLCYFRKGKYKESIRALVIAVKALETDPERHFALSKAYLQIRDGEKAELEASKALDLGISDRANTKTIIGMARIVNEDYENAIKIFKECSITHTPAILGIGKALFNKAKKASTKEKSDIYTEMISHYTSAIEINPNVSDYYIYRGMAYGERNNPGDWEKTLNDWKEAKILNPRDNKPWKTEGDFIYSRAIDLPPGPKQDENLNHALKNYGEALMRAPERYKPALRNKRSRIYQALGKFNEALSEVKAGASENPDYVTNFMALAAAAISAFSWKDVITASSTGIEIADGIKSSGGKIWCLFFRIIGRCGDQQDQKNNIEDIRQLATELEKFPKFDSSEWDWIVAKKRLKIAMKDWPTEIMSLTLDSIEVIEKRLKPSQFRKKYVK